MKVEYYPKEMMIAGFYTKPLQGKVFNIFLNLILNLNGEDVHNIMCANKLTLQKWHKSNEPVSYDRSP